MISTAEAFKFDESEKEIAAYNLSEDEMDELERGIRADPVQWAYWKLKDPKGNPWKARWYQSKMIRGIMEGDRRIAARMGRRVGKTETMVVYCLWHAFHHKNTRLLIVAPYENQVRLIFMRLMELVADSEELSAAVKITKNPFIAEFGNGAKIMGFTGGANAGAQAGASVRGQRADFLFLDEVDYMSEEGIDAVTAIANEDPKNIGIWVSSTPTGKRSFFYKVCTDPNTGYKAYHYPSTVNPNFDERMEGELRATMTKQGYIHEVEAEFGEETVGVFNKNAVELAMTSYNYSYRDLNVWEVEQLKKQNIDVDNIEYIPMYTHASRAPKGIRIVGVDWDKFGDATQIIITKWNEEHMKFMVERRFEIERGEFTFDNAVNKLIEIDEIYNPNFFYIDAGYGEYQIEMLRKHGMNTYGSELHKKVKRIQFAQVFDVVDPATKEIDKKDAKNFMVNQTSIIVERGQLLLSQYDDMVWKQMMDYQVIRKTQSGKPVYTSENEHALDALMLTILGFTLEYPEITKILEEIHYASRSHAHKQNTEDKIRQKMFDSERELHTKKHARPKTEARDPAAWNMQKVTVGYKRGGTRTTNSFSRSKGSFSSMKRSSF